MHRGIADGVSDDRGGGGGGGGGGSKRRQIGPSYEARDYGRWQGDEEEEECQVSAWLLGAR